MVVHYDTVAIFIKIQDAVGIPLDIVFVVLSIMWAIYFINKIRICIKMHKTYLKEGNTEAARLYRCDAVKYVFLLLINITECGYIQIYALGTLLPSEHLYLESRPMLSNCSIELIHSHIFDINLILENPVKAFVIALGQVGLLFSLAFPICLMHYLHVTFHSIPLNPFQFIRRFLTFTSLLSLFLVIAGTVPQLILFQKFVEPLIELTYFLIWCRYCHKFYQTLKWRVGEFSARKPSLVKGAMENCQQFKAVMCCIGLATFLLISVGFIVSYFFLVTVALYYGPCLFNYVYGIPYYQPHLVSDGQIETLLYSYTIKVYITTLLLGVAIFILCFQFFVASAMYFWMFHKRMLMMRFGRVRTRFTPLNQRLLN